MRGRDVVMTVQSPLSPELLRQQLMLVSAPQARSAAAIPRPGSVMQRLEVEVTPAPRVAGDVLELAKHDTLIHNPWVGEPAQHEDTIVSVDPDGTSRTFAFRFHSWEIFSDLSGRGGLVTGVTFWLDNGFGRYAWPPVSIYAEDPTLLYIPHMRGAPLATLTAPLDGTVLESPAIEGEPDQWGVFQLEAAPEIEITPDHSFAAPAWSDAFLGTELMPSGYPWWNKDLLPRPLADPDYFTTWLECDALAISCKVASDPDRFLVVECPGCDLEVPARVRKDVAGSILGAKVYADPEHFGLRPWIDQDVTLSALIDVSDREAREAGLFQRRELRLDGSTAPGVYYYYAAYRWSGELMLQLVTPSGIVDLGAADAPPEFSPAELELTVTGANPTHLTARLKEPGTDFVLATVDFTDDDYRLQSAVHGLASLDSLSANEVWSNYLVRRNSDLFVVVEPPVDVPLGKTAGLPGDLSGNSVSYDNILRSIDLAAWEPEPLRPPGGGACKPVNAFVHLQTTDVSADGVHQLFQNEFRHNEVRFKCPTCTETVPAACESNRAPLQQMVPVVHGGAEPDDVEIFARWHNDSSPDLITDTPDCGDVGQPECGRTITGVWIWSLPGEAPLSYTVDGRCPLGEGWELVEQVNVYPEVRPGQNGSGWQYSGFCEREDPDDPDSPCVDEAPVTVWQPVDAGTYCIEVVEFWDLDANFVIDAPSPDDKPLTRGAHRYLEVDSSCAIAETSELCSNSLRAAKDASDYALTCVAWSDAVVSSSATFTLNRRLEKQPGAEGPIADSCFARYGIRSSRTRERLSRRHVYSRPGK